jgi:HAD superfamily hydrolase (TIGR01509 family)
MPLSSLIFGSIGALVETSDLQRQSFNPAFKKADLDWHWSPEEYRALLDINGGQNRLRFYAQQKGDEMTDDQIAGLHQAKTNAYAHLIANKSLMARPGIATLIKTAKNENIKMGVASTTSIQNINAILESTTDLSKSDFDFILSGEDVPTVKPEPEIYDLAAHRAACPVSEILVIEDTPVSAKAAKTAGLTVLIYSGEMTGHQDASVADHVVKASDLSLNRLSEFLN